MASCDSKDKGDGKSENTFTNGNGYKIFCKYWSKDLTAPRALVFICHGAAEHCLWYTQLAELLKSDGLYVFAHDHQGHGQSGGPRMHITDFRHYVRDVFQHTEMVKKEFPNLPLFIVGHSMGGTVSILSGLDRPDYFRGVVLIGPVVTPEQDTVGPVRVFFGKLLARIIPHCPVLWLDDSDISRDKAVCQKYKDDPLNYHGGLKAKWALCLLQTLQEIEQKLGTIKWPFLILHGDSDKMVNSKGSQAMYSTAASEDKMLKIYPGAYHQLHSEIEPDGSQARRDVLEWLVQRLP